MPWVTVEHNVAFSARPENMVANAEEVIKACDYVGGDLDLGVFGHSFTCKFYKNITKNQPFEHMFTRCAPGLSVHTQIKSPDVMSSAFFLALYSAVNGYSFTGYSQNTWLAFLGIAFLATICGQFLFNVLLKRLPATFITMSILGESVGTCILAWLILHEVLSLRQLVGIIVILGGLLIFFMNQKKKE
jgi:uncharacterized membrane protein